MSNTIFLTQDIGNQSVLGVNGYIDNLEQKFKEQPINEKLEVVICSGGGDIYQGNRLHNLVSSHKGYTLANVTGIAASMAGVLLADFDKVIAEKSSRVMLHKAHIESGIATEEDKEECRSFNKMAYDRLKLKIQSKKLENEAESISILDKIFLDNSFNKDVNFTAQEAKDFGIVDEVYEVQRVDGDPIMTKIAARLLEYKNEYSKLIYNNYKMGIFSKKDPVVARTAELKNGGTIVFNSADEQLKQGDKVALVGSEEAANGAVDIGNNQEAKIVDGQVDSVENVDSNEGSNEEVMTMLSDIKESFTVLSDRVSALEGGDKPNEEVENKIDAVANSVAEIKNALGGNVVSNYRLPSIEKKNEGKKSNPYLGASKEQAIKLNEVLTAK